MRRLRLPAQALALALVAGLLALLVWKLAHGSKGNVKVGRGTPSFTLSRLSAPGDLSLRSLRGKAVVLNFWASWCVPCKKEAPLLQSAWQRWRPQDVVVLGVDSRDFAGDARRFVRRYGLTYPMVRDGSGAHADSYGVSGYPETFFLDREGRLTEHLVGQVSSRTQLDAAIRQALRS